MKCLSAYSRQYPLDRCGLDAESEKMIIESPDGRRAVQEPIGETGTRFMDRLRRSRKDFRNYFYLEWDRCLTLTEREDATGKICRTCIDLYQSLFPEDRFVPGKGGRASSIYWPDPAYPEGLILLVEPEGETNRIFFERLERCRAEGRNLFHEEWRPG